MTLLHHDHSEFISDCSPPVCARAIEADLANLVQGFADELHEIKNRLDVAKRCAVGVYICIAVDILFFVFDANLWCGGAALLCSFWAAGYARDCHLARAEFCRTGELFLPYFKLWRALKASSEVTA
jgi:hypothetical protein